MPVTAFIGLGSNLGPAIENCHSAIKAIKKIPQIKITQRSSFYETEPVGEIEQNWFINLVIEIETSLTPKTLLDCLLKIEKNMGRIRKEKWGPRLIDLDLLFYGNKIIHSKNLKVPHPEIQRRKFVLDPLNEIRPGFRHPVLKKTVQELAADQKEASTVRRLSTSI